MKREENEGCKLKNLYNLPYPVLCEIGGSHVSILNQEAKEEKIDESHFIGPKSRPILASKQVGSCLPAQSHQHNFCNLPFYEVCTQFHGFYPGSSVTDFSTLVENLVSRDS